MHGGRDGGRDSIRLHWLGWWCCSLCLIQHEERIHVFFGMSLVFVRTDSNIHAHD